MTSRDRISATLKGEIPDKIGVYELFWEDTLDLWRTQGMPAYADPSDYFNLDMYVLFANDNTLGLPEEIIEETDGYKLYRDRNGVLRKDQKHGTGWTPQWLDYRIKTLSDWEEVKELMVPRKDRIKWDIINQEYKKHREEDRFICYGLEGIYVVLWGILGQVETFTYMLDDPDFLRDIMDSIEKVNFGILEMAYSEGIRYDGVFIGEDLGYRNGTFFSPQIYKELFLPYHKRWFDKVHEMGLPVIMHSCGKIESLLPYLIEAGLDGIEPIEAKTGQDIRDLKKLYGGKITFFGNMDVRKLSGSKEDIEEEVLGKLKYAMDGGRYVFHSDHSIPPTVNLDNYKYALELAGKFGKY